MRTTPLASATVNTTGSPSGTALLMARATATANIAAEESPSATPMTNTAAAAASTSKRKDADAPGEPVQASWSGVVGIAGGRQRRRPRP